MTNKNYVFLIIIGITVACKRNYSVCYVNCNKLLQGYHGASIQHELFKAKDWQQHVDSLSIELQKLSKAPAITYAKEQQLLRYRDAIQQQAQQESQRLTQAVFVA